MSSIIGFNEVDIKSKWDKGRIGRTLRLGIMAGTAAIICGRYITSVWNSNSLKQRAIEEVVKNRISVMPNFILANEEEVLAEVIREPISVLSENGRITTVESEGIRRNNPCALARIPNVMNYHRDCLEKNRTWADRSECLEPLRQAYFETLSRDVRKIKV